MTIPCVLTIAASDSSGAAGLQADLKTFEARQVYGLSAITALTAQNSQSIRGFSLVEPAFVARQIAALFEDIAIAAIKTGMLLRVDIMDAALSAVPDDYAGALVVDPVLVAGDGRRLVDDAVIGAYRTRLFPRATIITPNLDEAEILTGRPVRTVDAMQEAARALHRSGARCVLIKGGHLPDQTDMVDVLFDGQDMYLFSAPCLPAQNPRGTGCTFASCIAAELAKGATVVGAVQRAKGYVTEALRAALDWHIGHGRGTLAHGVGRPPLEIE